jgi:hypothetical protein
LDPYKSAELSEGDLDTVAPRIGNSIGGSLYSVSDVSQRPSDPFRMIIEGSDDQEPGCCRCRDTEGMNFCMMLEAGIVRRLIDRRRADHQPSGDGTNASLKDWPRIQTIRTTKAKLIDDLEHSKLDADIAPYLGHTSSVDRTINEVREQVAYIDRMLEAA